MSWKKYFRVAEINNISPLANGRSNNSDQFAMRNWKSQLPEVYIGHPNRLERYNQYEAMDTDSEVNSALDVLAEFCTQKDSETNKALKIEFQEDPTDREVKILREQLAQWMKLNKLDKRLFRMFRNTIKYGDQVFIRDPETFEMYWVEMHNVVKVIVNESQGKEPEQYLIKDISPNFKNLTATQVAATDTYTNHPTVGGGATSYGTAGQVGGGGSRFSQAQNESAINAEHIVHMSLTEGLDMNWPFGTSVLEQVYKVFKQKELLEDAIIIYRIQRAPERRMFKIDVGNMPSHLAMAFIERVKNEVHQRRIPSHSGGGSNMMDATYNPLSINEDYFFPVTADGHGSSIETLPGGQNLGEIDDLRFFTNKLFRGLRIPSSYLPTGPEDGTSQMNDGRVGTAMIQEWRFNQYCKRLQSLIIEKLNDEFKTFLRWRGINIDGALFDLEFIEPQNFSGHRQVEIDTERVAVFSQLEGYQYFSRRFLISRYLGLTEEEMTENDEKWREEKGEDAAAGQENVGLRSVGITPGGMDADLSGLDDMGMDGDPMSPDGAVPGGPGGPGGAMGGAPGAAGAAPAPGGPGAGQQSPM